MKDGLNQAMCKYQNVKCGFQDDTNSYSSLRLTESPVLPALLVHRPEHPHNPSLSKCVLHALLSNTEAILCVRVCESRLTRIICWLILVSSFSSVVISMLNQLQSQSSNLNLGHVPKEPRFSESGICIWTDCADTCGMAP